MLRICISLWLLAARHSLTAQAASAPSGVWDEFNYAPASKTVWPASIKLQVGNVTNAQNLVNNIGAVTLSGNNSYVTLDYGVEVRVHSFG